MAAAKRRIDAHPDNAPDTLTREMIALLAMRSLTVVRGVLAKLRAFANSSSWDSDSDASLDPVPWQLHELGCLLVSEAQSKAYVNDVLWPLIGSAGTYRAVPVHVPIVATSRNL